jgi:nuclear transport factor 2 (NTF2) superfamily protein
MQEELRLPAPPFTTEAAEKKVRTAENAWNTRDPDWVSTFFTPDTRWLTEGREIVGRNAIMDVLTDKWAHELDFRLVQELWTHDLTRISVRCAYEFRNPAGTWFRCHGDENWEFDRLGLLSTWSASASRSTIDEHERLLLWEAPRARPSDHAGLLELGL